MSDGAAPGLPGGPVAAGAPVAPDGTGAKGGGERPAPLLWGLPTGWPFSLPLALAAGFAVALLGTVVHRAVSPWGVVLALAGALSAGVLARALAGGMGVAAYGGALLLVTQLASTLRPGGDVLVAGDVVGYLWLYGSVATAAVVAFLPARWFARDARGG
jgi:hypothetical protein